MTEKNPYSPPQLYEVTLDQEQAILTACSLTTVSIAAGTGTNGCRVNGNCESAMCGGQTCHDSGNRAS